ncbi:hypothetical protein N7451_009885 [Penicillium sp. IBT 35674x]|nr:hypothetical protein N7451_009885 [Penicillium sp. IBT 35674x]
MVTHSFTTQYKCERNQWATERDSDLCPASHRGSGLALHRKWPVPRLRTPPALAGMANATWSKKYIWRLSDATSQLSVWFVKVGSGPDEADYLFHNFDFTDDGRISLEGGEEHFPPVPALPTNTRDEQTYVLQARGDHLCINDMYRTSYAFRFLRDTEELVSWSSLHVVRGPAKTQEIRNQYALQRT